MYKYDSLFIGSSTKDIIMLVDSPPQSDRRISASALVFSPGGVASTAAAAHHKLGGKTGMMTIVGNDDSGAYIEEDLTSQGFQYLEVLHTNLLPSSTSLIQTEKNGKRCITCFGGCIKELTFDMIDTAVIRQFRHLHLGVMNDDLMLRLAKFCKEETSTLLSVDGGNIPRDLTDRLLPYCDFFIPDHKTAEVTLGLAPQDACRYYVSKGAGFAAVTAADSGVYAYDGVTSEHISSIDVQVLDTTGAGDNFHGAFLYAVSQHYPIRDSLAFAGIFASLSCEGLGGRSATPDLETVLQRMKAPSR